MPACANCGGHVSTDYFRVFAPDDGVIRGCPACDASPVGVRL